MNNFLMGVMVGFAVATVCAFISFGGEKRIETKTKIKPEWQLVTDGKVIDTVYIYTEK